jgi:YD repeat-containing protein
MRLVELSRGISSLFTKKIHCLTRNSYLHLFKNKRSLCATLLISLQLLSPASAIVYAGAVSSNDVGSSASLDPVSNKATRLQTQGSSGVDQSTGAFTYSYPIALPEGRNGMTPKLTLSYNSQNTESGWFGYNWLLSIPYIERTVKTGSDKLYTNPSFVSSLHGEIISNNGSTYEQKVDDGSYAKYTFTGASWQMTDRDGTTYYFGNSYTSRVQDDAGTKIGRWYLTEVRDKFGNGMTYQYSKDGGTVYPQSISYTEHALAREVNVVTFTLESKQDALSNYRYGFRTIDSKRISAIKLNANGKDIAFISFSYLKGSNNSRSLLQSVEEKRLSTNDDWTVLPKTTFEYENSPITFSGSISTTANPYGTNNVVMDINNDGIQDIYNAGDGFYPVDINGDFKKDLAQSDINYGVSSNNQYIIFKYNQGGSFLTRNLAYPKDGYVRTQPVGMPMPTIRYIAEGQWWWTQESVIADINGDGFDDVIYNNPYVGQGVGINTTNNTFDYSKPSSLAFNILNDQIVDINGDGLQDKISRTTSSTSTLFRVYLNNGSQYASTSEFVYDAKIASTPYDIGVRFSDVNNDGLPDVLRSYTSSYTTQGYTAGCAAGYTAPPSTAPINQTINEILINTGTSFVPASSTVPGYFVTYSACTAGSSYYNLYTTNTREHDANGDLTTDYDGATNNTQKQDILKKVVSPLGATLDVSYTWTTKTGLNPKLPVPTYIVATTTEKLSPSDTNPRAVGYSFHDGQMYFNETSPRDRKFAGFAKVEVVDGTTKTVTYYHQGNGDDYLTGEKGDSYHNIGRPYRTDVFDSSSGSSTLLSKSLSLYTTYSFASSTFTYIDAQVVNSYNSNGTHLSSASKYAYDETKRLIKTSYDYGDIDTFTSFASSTISDKGTDILTTSYQYSTGRPERLIKQTVADYSGNILDSTSNYYDGLPFGLVDKGALTSSINTLYTSTGSVATTTTSQITYDATGNVIQTSNPLNQVTKFVYDTSYLYPVQKIDPLNGTTTYTYDPYTQNLLIVTTPDGITSVKETDGFGNTVRSYTKSSSGGIYDDVKTVYAYGSGLSVYGVRMNITGNPSRTFEKYDAYGRRIQSKVETTQDVFLTEDITYDAKGNIVSSSLPYTAQGYGYTTDTPANGKIVYGYDALGRVTAKQSFGTNLTYQYGARSLTVFDNAETQHKKSYTYDARNNLTSVTEYNNGQTYVTSYSYTPLSKLSRITDANGNIRNFSYRSDGKLAYQEDPHTSTDTTYTTYTYTHDALGNLLTKSGPLGSISYSYDKLNRPTSRVVSDTANGTSTLSISYSGCTNSYMSPCVVNRGTSSTTYAYDQSGRLLSDTLSIDGRVFTRSYTYDSLGNPLTITYPDNGRVTYTYTLDGKQSSLSYTTPSGAIKPIVTGETYTSLGQVSSRIYGNGVRMCNTYTTQSLGGVIAPRLGTSVYMFNTDGCAQAPNQIELYKDQFTYKDSLTPNSILTTYKDIKGVTNTKSDTFTYDNLARLTGVSTSYNGTTAIVESLTYDPIGNLLKHNDILYRYSKDGQQNVHAATSVGGTHIDYDAQGNRVRVGDNVYTWNTLNQMLSASSTNGTEFYTYDENGERIKKVIKANTIINQKATPAQATSTLSTFRVGDLLATVATTSMYVATSSHAKLTTLNLLSTTTLTTLVGDIYGSPFVSKFCATQTSSSARQSCVATTTKQLLANNLNNRSTSTIASIGFVDDVIGIVTGKFLLPVSYTGIATSSIATSSNVVFAVDTATINAYTTYVGTGIVVPLTEYANLPLISTSTYTTLGQIGFADTSRIKALFTLAGCTTVASPCANAQKVVFEKMYKEKGYVLSDRALHEMWHVYAQKARIPTSGTDLTATSTFHTLSSIPTVSGITTSSATSTYSSGAYFTTQYSAQNTVEPRLQFIGTIPYYVSQSVFTELQQAGITQSTLENYQALIQDVFNIKVASSSDYMLALSLFAFYDKKTTLSVQALKELYLSAIGAAVIPNKVEDYTSVSVFDVSGNLIIKSYGKSGSNSYDILLSNTCRSAGSGNPHARCVIGSSQFTLPVASSSVIKYILTLLPPPSQAELPLVVGESPNPAYPISNGANYYSSERPIIFPNWYYSSNVVDPGYLKQEVDITSTVLKIQASSTAPEKFLAITEREWMTGSLWPYEAQSVTLKAYASTPRLTLASTTLTSLLDPYFSVISSSTASVATTSLLAYYKLDESSGNAVDATGNGYVLANSGSTGYASGKINNGAVFNNTNAKSLQNSGAINFVTGGTRTWTTWVNFSNINGYVLDNVTTNGNIRMIVYGGGDNKIHLFANGNEVVSGNLTTGTWYHVAATQNGSTWQLYINGVFIGSTSTGGLSYAANGFVIGNSYAGGGPGQNTTDEVSIWGRVLTPSEITSLYNAGNGLSYPFQGSAGQYQLVTTTFTPQIQSSFASYFAEIYDSSSLYVSTSTIATTTAISLESSLEFASTTLRDAYDISKVFLATTTPWCTSNASTTECDKQARKSFFKEVIKNLSGFSPSDAAVEEFWMVHKGLLFIPDSTYASTTVMVTTPGYWKSLEQGASLPTGGTITNSGQYRIHTFTSSGNFNVPFPINVELLVVGGGGNGGGGNSSYAGGGGGAGQVATSSSYLTQSLSTSVTIGQATQSSSFGPFIAVGGSNGNFASSGGSSGNGFSGGANWSK